jgi:branched-chain amino acid transport system permease protein
MLQGAVAGLAAGGTYAVIAVCLTLMAQLIRVINFAQAAVGMFAAFVSVWLANRGVPLWLAILIALAVGVGLSALTGLIITKWLSQSSISQRSAVTVGVLLILVSLSYILFGTKPQAFQPLVPGPAFEVGGIVVTNLTVVTVCIAVGVAVAAWAVLRFTPVGIRLRAIADRPTTADMLGVPVRALVLGVWMVTGLITSVVIILIAPAQSSDASALSFLVIQGAAAALVGAFKRLDLAVIGGLVLGMLQGIVAQSQELALVRELIPLVLIIVFLLWNQRKEVWDAVR